MTTFRRWLFTLGASALFATALTSVTPAARAQGVPGVDPNKCLAGKTKCVEKKVAGLFKCRAKCQNSPAGCGPAQSDCEAKVIARFDGGANAAKGCFATLEAKDDPAKPDSVCMTTGDTDTMEALADDCVGGLVATLEGNAPPACPSGGLPATGQTMCWNFLGSLISCGGTGHDGDVQAGATLSFTDNGNGTITDDETGLMWEKKSDDGSIHDWDALHLWDQAFSGHVKGLNDATFAGYTDWRVPNVKELQSIVNYQNSNPSVSSAFNTGCTAGCTVTTCSCTKASWYWSSTSLVNDTETAWYMSYSVGDVSVRGKGDILYVRAVRGGS